MDTISALSTPGMIVIFSIMMVTVMAMMSALVYVHTRRQLDRQHYDEANRRAKLSDERAWFEMRIAELNERMIASEARWREANHLIVSGAKAAKEGPVVEPSLSQFLINLGVTKNDLVLDDDLVFVLTPFGEEELSSFQVVKEICSNIGLKAMRGDETYTPGDILTHVVKKLVKSRLVIANISSRNPNVFYELGIAHALDKPTLLISHTLNEVPFDVKNQRIVIFKDEQDLEKSLTAAIARVLSRPMPQPNKPKPWATAMSAQTRKSLDPHS